MKATKFPHTSIQISTLGDYDSLWEFLSSLLSCSKNAVKNYYSSVQLAKPVRKGQVLSLPINLVNRGMICPDYCGPEVEILFENDFFLALSKPTKIHIHPLEYLESDNLLSYLRSKGKSQVLEVNKDHYDRGILYRLDYETSGVVICTKCQELYRDARENFSKVAKEKIYWAIVQGNLSSERSLRSYLSSIQGGKKMSWCESAKGEGQWGELKVTPVKYHPERDLTLVSIALSTGLRHQIRVQLASIGHPILGDELYGGRASSRLFLHAASYRMNIDEHLVEVRDASFPQFDELFQINF